MENDFDFLIGEWTVRHRRLKRRLASDSEWIEFAGPASVHRRSAGWGNLDECEIAACQARIRGRRCGCSIRGPPSGPHGGWTAGTLPDPPMIGTFENGRGLFYGDDTFESTPGSLHLTSPPDDQCRWEQASPQMVDTWRRTDHELHACPPRSIGDLLVITRPGTLGMAQRLGQAWTAVVDAGVTGGPFAAGAAGACADLFRRAEGVRCGVT